MSKLRIWIEACRPKTLVAALVPVAIGGSVYWTYGDLNHEGTLAEYAFTFACCLGFAFGAQIVSNFANDLGDSLRGADTAARVGPHRAVANGLISPRAMQRGVVLAALGACLAGTPIGLHEPVLFIAGILALILALAYTLGPLPLAYLGLGDVFVVACFGLQATVLTAYALQVMVRDCTCFVMPWVPGVIAGLGVGLLADNILLANNARDLETDLAAGKRTTVVRFGRGFARGLHLVNLVGGLACLGLVFGWLPLLVTPWALWQHRGFRQARSPAEFVPFLAQAALLLLLAGALCVTAACLDLTPVGRWLSR